MKILAKFSLFCLGLGLCFDYTLAIESKDFKDLPQVETTYRVEFPAPFGETKLLVGNKSKIYLVSDLGDSKLGINIAYDVKLKSTPSASFVCYSDHSCDRASEIRFVFELDPPYLNPTDPDDILTDFLVIRINVDGDVSTEVTKVGEILSEAEKVLAD